MQGADLPAGAIALGPDVGRHYGLGRMRAVFKADGDETGERYSVSEWWLEPHADGPGAHSHEVGDELFYVIEGEAAVLVGDTWVKAPAGSFVRVPAGVRHDFANRTDRRAGLLNVFTPGGFEKHMPAIVAWFQGRSLD